MIPTWAQLLYLLGAVCFILALKGLSGPKTARNGNLIGAFGAVLACAIPFFYGDLDHVPLILAAIAVGTVGGVYGARTVQMTQMPQMVALFNGVGGGAAALVALLELHEIVELGRRRPGVHPRGHGVHDPGRLGLVRRLDRHLRQAPGADDVAAGDLPRLPGPVRWRLRRRVVLSVLLVNEPEMWLGIVLGLLGLLVGVLLVLPVGGADVPIVISLLNAFTGLTVAAGGYVLSNTLLLVAGTLVGASGTFLTLLMANAMGRSVINILFGALKGGSTLGGGEASDRPVRSGGPEDVAIMLGYADRVIIVPGYGLAVAQAQHTLRELVDLLIARGTEVDYAIHPVAGRMPGHMNVLLAEANVPYEQLIEMDEINDEFKDADVVLVVGANDVVNPAARNDPERPDLRHADPRRRPGQGGRVPQALDAPRLRRHRERAALRARDHAAVR